MKSQGESFSTNIVNHSVPCKVLAPTTWALLQEPTIPDSDVHIILPPLLHVRNISERFRTLSDRILVKANMTGTFALSMESDAVCIETIWRDLVSPMLDPSQVESVQQHPSHTRPKDKFVILKVDAKEWVNLLRVYTLAKRVIACRSFVFFHRLSFLLKAFSLLYWCFLADMLLTSSL